VHLLSATGDQKWLDSRRCLMHAGLFKARRRCWPWLSPSLWGWSIPALNNQRRRYPLFPRCSTHRQRRKRKTPYPFGYGAGYWWPTRPNKLDQ